MKPETTLTESSTATLEKPSVPAISVPTPKSAAAPNAVHQPKNFIWATGRRKTSVAQVRMVFKKSSGKILVNKKSVEDYFKGNKWHAATCMQSYQLCKNNNEFDLFIKVNGGGLTGQAEAIRYGIARALLKWDPQLKPLLRKEGFLSRDPRMVERKKPGQPKARKRFQYSKR